MFLILFPDLVINSLPKATEERKDLFWFTYRPPWWVSQSRRSQEAASIGS